MKLLIVEDNAPMREMTKRMVGDLADHISERSDGDEVLAAYAAERPDWVLMDIEMKRMNGIAATRQLLAAFPEARVLIVTNYNDQPLREAARKAGACGYVLKENLIEVRRLLQPHSELKTPKQPAKKDRDNQGETGEKHS